MGSLLVTVPEEFEVLGVPKRRHGRRTDETMSSATGMEEARDFRTTRSTSTFDDVIVDSLSSLY